ncbi:MAG: SDR family NAD(P)-dependent oxidoreductase [candidate division Zixibacteria bacterium]|nr:SDR family NAD(P)-dependent oxidoreductase [candidate division Zixibacteria bacterium]
MKNLNSKKILVTGASGFIGSHVTELLLEAGARVTAFVRYTSSGQAGFLDEFKNDCPKRLKIIRGDIRNRDDVCRAAKGNDIIINLAAQIAIPYSYLAPDDFLDVNAGGFLNVYHAACEYKIKRVVQLSTSEVYGSAQYVPIDEKHPIVAQSPYSASKISADKLAESFFRSFAFPVVTARPFNTYGPRQSARAVIPTIILQALTKKTIKLGNIDTRRDMNFVLDTASALIKIALSSKGTGGVYNLCTGIDISIGEIVAIVEDIMGKKLTIKTERKRVRPKKSEVTRLMGDGSLADRTFRLKKRTDIRKGLKQTIVYFEKRIKTLNKEDYQL